MKSHGAGWTTGRRTMWSGGPRRGSRSQELPRRFAQAGAWRQSHGLSRKTLVRPALRCGGVCTVELELGGIGFPESGEEQLWKFWTRPSWRRAGQRELKGEGCWEDGLRERCPEEGRLPAAGGFERDRERQNCTVWFETRVGQIQARNMGQPLSSAAIKHENSLPRDGSAASPSL